jgi:hypothetical protein
MGNGPQPITRWLDVEGGPHRCVTRPLLLPLNSAGCVRLDSIIGAILNICDKTSGFWEMGRNDEFNFDAVVPFSVASGDCHKQRRLFQGASCLAMRGGSARFALPRPPRPHSGPEHRPSMRAMNLLPNELQLWLLLTNQPAISRPGQMAQIVSHTSY